MTKCDGCGNEVGNLFCGHCRAKLELKMKLGEEELEKLIPLLYYDPKQKAYRFGCTCLKCPCNAGGVCGAGNHQTLKSLFELDKIHEFDGDNILRQVCG